MRTLFLFIALSGPARAARKRVPTPTYQQCFWMATTRPAVPRPEHTPGQDPWNNKKNKSKKGDPKHVSCALVLSWVGLHLQHTHRHQPASCSIQKACLVLSSPKPHQTSHDRQSTSRGGGLGAGHARISTMPCGRRPRCLLASLRALRLGSCSIERGLIRPSVV